MGMEMQEEDIQMFLLYLHGSMDFGDLVPEKQKDTAGKRQRRRKKGQKIRVRCSQI